LSSALKTMGTQAFSYCTSLTSITIPKTLQECSTSAYISYNAKYDGPFYECSALKSVTFEEGSTKIAHRVLSGCTGIEVVTIPETVTEIGEKAFGQCTSLKKIEIPLSVTKIDSYAFAYCSALEVAKIGDSVTTIGAYVFYECKNLLLVEIPDSVISMGNYDFYGCSGLQSVKLSSKQEKIMSYMFYGCTNLTTIELPNSVTTIQQYAFSNTGLKKIVLSENVITVNDRAFYDCDALTDINIPNSVTSIGTYCFANCEALNNITLGTGIGIIPAYAFYQCPALESIVLPYRVTSIGEYAFANNTKLVSVFIPRNTTSIDTTTFSYPSRMTIYGITGTYAETFANEQGITFVNQEVNATEATLSASNLTINKGEKETLTLKVLPADFTDEVTWKSSDTSVATVTDAGVVTAVATGTATIKVTVGSVSASCKVTVIQPVTGISLNKTSLSLEALDTYQLKATVSPTTAADKTVTWTSSEPNVATVDESGLVTALSKGTTKVTVKANDGSGVSKTCNVTVTNTAHICTTVDEMESPHNYTNDCSDYWVYTASGVTRLAVTFDERTNIEDGFDYLYIYDEEGTEIGKYTGTELAGQTVNLTGNTVKIKLVSDSSGNEWGFKVTDIDSSCQHTSTKIQNKKDATCTENGYTGDVVCEDCGKIIETGTVIEAAGHTVVNVSAVDATCTTDGNTAGKYCSVCDEILEGMTVIPAKGHTEVIDEKVDATCTENGLTEGKHCSVCHAILVEQTVILASHNWDEGVESVAPTCDDEGVILYTCKVCGETKTQAIAKKGHTSEKDEAVEPTCTTPGLTEGSHCSVCGAIIEAQEEVPAKGHDLETITTKATTSKNGSVVEKCSVCGEITSETDIYYPKTITLSKTSFVYSGNVQKPAVTVKGSDGKGIAASNYTLTYSSGCKNVGKYTVKITFKGNYSGNISKTFTIVPKGTSISKLTASSKGFTVKWKKQATQTSGYQIQYSTKSNFAGAKTVTVTKNSTVSKKITKLSAKKKYYVRIRTYKTVSGTKYYSSWSSAKQVTTKK
ncbi:MAG: leucine-rich repeat protein, partial [Lachnospiraceae bacterium]